MNTDPELVEMTRSELEEIDRSARAYGFEIGRGTLLANVVESSDDNPFLDKDWRKKIK